MKEGNEVSVAASVRLVAPAGDRGGRRRRNAFLPPAARLPRLETASLTLGATETSFPLRLRRVNVQIVFDSPEAMP